MSEHSLPTELTERFLRGEASRSDNQDVVRHLLTVTSQEAPAIAVAGREIEEPDLEAAFERALARAAAEDERSVTLRSDAKALLAEIEARLESEGMGAVEQEARYDTRFASWAVSEILRKQSFETGLSDPKRAVELARLAVVAAERVAAADPGTRLEQDQLALAWGQLGNALRISTDLDEAEASLSRAQAFADGGTGDPLVHGQLKSFAASLAKGRGYFDDGIALCRKASRFYRRAGDRHGQGRMLIHEADLHVNNGDVLTAIACLERAGDSVDTAAEPRLALVIAHNLASNLDQQERYDEAWDRLGRARELAERSGQRLDLVRLRWLEGRIAAHRGDERHGERCWNEARDAFIELDVGYDAALVSLELAALLARQGRRTELLRLVEEMLPIFESRSVHREAQVALGIFRKAVAEEQAGLVELAREVHSYLKRAQDRPDVAFRAVP